MLIITLNYNSEFIRLTVREETPTIKAANLNIFLSSDLLQKDVLPPIPLGVADLPVAHI